MIIRYRTTKTLQRPVGWTLYVFKKPTKTKKNQQKQEFLQIKTCFSLSVLVLIGFWTTRSVILPSMGMI